VSIEEKIDVEIIEFKISDYLNLYISQVLCSKITNSKCFKNFYKNCCRKKKDKKTRRELLNELYVRGTTRIHREFSVERLLINMREMKLLMKNEGFLTK
jgi:hypothetical protein